MQNQEKLTAFKLVNLILRDYYLKTGILLNTPIFNKN